MQDILDRGPVIVASVLFVAVLLWRGVAWRRAVLWLAVFWAFSLASILAYSWFVWEPLTTAPVP